MFSESKTEKPPHQILGIPKDANLDEIKAAYKSLVKIHHPDLNGGRSSQKFLQIQKAYEELNPKNIKSAEPEIKTREVQKTETILDQMLDSLLKTGVQNLTANQQAKEAQELIPFRDATQRLANQVLKEINYQPIEFGGKSISTLKIKEDLVRIVQDIFRKSRKPDMNFLTDLQRHLNQIILTQKEAIQQQKPIQYLAPKLASRLAYLFNIHFPYMKENQRFNPEAMNTLIFAAQYSYSKMDKSKENEMANPDITKLTDLKHESVKYIN